MNEQDNNISSDVSLINKTSNNKLWSIIIALGVIAVIGIGFGIFGMLQYANSKTATAVITGKNDVDISDNDQQIQTQDGDGVGDDTLSDSSIEIAKGSVTESGPYIADGYFLVPKWGVKFKVPSDVADFGYAVTTESQGDTYSDYVIGVTAIKKSDIQENPQGQYYHDIFSCSLVTIRDFTRTKWVQDLNGLTNIDVAYLDNHSFVIHDTWRQQNCSEPEFYVDTDAVTQELKNMFLHPEKI